MTEYTNERYEDECDGVRRVIARRNSYRADEALELQPSPSSQTLDGGIVGTLTIGQDGFTYMVHGNFSHSFVPYISRTTGEPNGGCDTCGWSEQIHGEAPTHIHCDNCLIIVPVEGIVEAHSATIFRTEPRTATLQTGRVIELPPMPIADTRFFCGEACKVAWFGTRHGSHLRVYPQTGVRETPSKKGDE